ncbi:DUF4166 domain-containing protein [Acaricomes phytoseiuli]|uniref:DUF4166 domain-containing protein n=1 Tax=Acaricomes phytoseiuli TaxID=291968 RepID=UPI000368EAF3|nr:DUF4166 domain-containing protein [Acaricomes phytoseiuli]
MAQSESGIAEAPGAVYALALGADFARLQPELQEYFSLSPDAGLRGIGTGTFRLAGCPRPLLRPVFRCLADVFQADLFFPEYAQDVPFVVENRAHLDAEGHSALTQLRKLRFGGSSQNSEDGAVTRRFLDTTVWSDGALADFLGRGALLQTRLVPWVDAEGRLRAVSDRLRLALPLRLPNHRRAFLPLPGQGKAYALQWWDSEAAEHRIQVKVLHPWFGVLFLYAGSFSYWKEPVSDAAEPVSA